MTDPQDPYERMQTERGQRIADERERLEAIEDASRRHVNHVGIWCSVGLCFVLGTLFGSCAGYQKYKVYSAQMDGLALLREADSSRQVAVLEAHAKREAATELAQAEVERAHGVAAANKIIGDSLHGNEDYLRYLWIQALETGKSEVIYVPTEANLPILESTRKLKLAAPFVEPKQ